MCYRYGAFDLLLATIRPDGAEIRFEYDSLTRLKKVINATGDVYSYERDKAGQIIREVDFAGREIKYRYDRLGRRIATRSPDNHELRYHYDETGLVTEQSIWLSDGIEHKCLSTTTYQYNEVCNLFVPPILIRWWNLSMTTKGICVASALMDKRFSINGMKSTISSPKPALVSVNLTMLSVKSMN